jgi:hypothetical protein
MRRTDTHRHLFSKPVRSLTSVAVAVAAIVVLQMVLRSAPDLPTEKSTDDIRHDRAVVFGGRMADKSATTAVMQVEALPRLPLPAVALSADTQALVDRNGIEWARQLLLQQAMEAAARSDDNSMAGLLAELGELSLIEADIDTAEMYLEESLDLFRQQQNELAQAGVYMQLGRLHLLTRQRARVASNAYDQLLISRWKISNGLFYDAEADLLLVADNNLKLQRYGAAASTYETLYRGYLQEGDLYQAQTSGIEAIKLYASSGRMFDAQRLQKKMITEGIDETVFRTLAPELERLREEFNHSVKALGVARDQAQLYNQLQARGDVVNAWRFRQQAHQALNRASKRAQYRSQPDVLAELYRSNRSKTNARQSLSKAKALFYEYGFETDVLQRLQDKVY